MNNDTELTKLEDKLGNSFAAEIRHLSKVELEKRLLELAKNREEITTSKKEDQKLNDAKEQVKYLNEPYKDAMKVVSEKSRFIALILTEKEVV
jgi:hypothetical protein